MNLKTFARSLIIAAIASFILYFVSCLVVREFVASEIPPQWDSIKRAKTFGDIYAAIGPPQEEASAKDYANWVESHWWGKKVLTAVSKNCCSKEAKPMLVIYKVYFSGKYEAIFQQVILGRSDS